MKLIFLMLLCISSSLFGQVSKTSELYKTLKQNDSLLFEVGFNHCDLAPFERLLSVDLEFYHDQGGILNSKAEFIETLKNGICKSDDFVARRVLLENTLEVYPLYNNGVIYGAIQQGSHQFFEKPNGRPETKGSIAMFTHLWLLENEQWLLKRILSYDHRMKQ